MKKDPRKPQPQPTPGEDLDPAAMFAEAADAMALAKIGSILLDEAKRRIANRSTQPPNPYRDRSGNEQGHPLTETEIREGIEDVPGTLANLEIDDDAFCGPDEECR